MSKEKKLHVQEEAQKNSDILVAKEESCFSIPSAQDLPHHSGFIGKWMDNKEENALAHIPGGESVIDQMIQADGSSICQNTAAEDQLCQDIRKIEEPFVTDTKFERLGGNFRR
ncbi:MAG: hypothetical protein ACI3XC_07410 [Phascolarctobacterium sp.]